MAQNSWSEMWLSTFEIGLGQLCSMRNRDEITVLMCEEKPNPARVWCRRKSHPVESEKSPKRNQNEARLTRALDLVLISSPHLWAPYGACIMTSPSAIPFHFVDITKRSAVPLDFFLLDLKYRVKSKTFLSPSSNFWVTFSLKTVLAIN